MSQGMDRRAEHQDNLRGAEAINPVTRSIPAVGAPRAPSAPDTSFSSQIAGQVSKFVGGKLAEAQAKRQERSMTEGQIAAMQGRSFDSVEMEGDKWALEGWRVVSAQSMSSSLLRAQESEISTGAYEQDPDTYRNTLVNRIDAMTKDIPDERTRKLAQDNLMQQMPGLIDVHMKQNLAFKEQQNFDALAQSVDVLSRDNSSTGALVAFATGQSEATAGLSIERRRTAVVQGVVNAFTNNNPAAFAHLEAAEFFTTENLTSSQLQQVRSAQNAYETRLRQQWNGELKAEMTKLSDRVENGEVDPLVAAEEQARILGKHGLRMKASEGSQIYDRARAGVEFSEGTRGLNIQAAGTSGDFNLQARLMQDAVIHQESRGNPNAVSHKGATGIMQLMPATAMNPGFGVRNIFQVARSLGVPVTGETEATAQTLMRNELVNKTMGTEYLAAMLKRYNGNEQLALVAYNAGAGRADQLKAVGGDWSKISGGWKAEAMDYEKKIRSSYNDNRPDPGADRVAAEHQLAIARERAGLAVLEAIGPAMAHNDEMFTRGEIGIDEWRNTRSQVYEQWGAELDHQRINQEQQMMRSVAGQRIAELQSSNNVQQAVQLQTGLAAADVELATRRAEFEAGTSTLNLDEINQEYMGAVVDAYTQSGVELDAGSISSRAADLVTGSAGLVARALKAQEEAAIISNAETASTVGSLPDNLKDRAVEQFRGHLSKQVENFKAENPTAGPAEVGAMQRQAEVEYLASNGIVDEALQQQINLAASGRWIDQAGEARPSTVVGLHSFVSMLAENPDLAYQYVPDAEARGRMMAASHLVTSLFPDRDVYTDVDLSNKQDPVANAFYDAVQQVGLTVNSAPSKEETVSRVAQAVKLMNSGNITNSWFGGTFSDGPAESLVPSSMLGAGLSSRFDIADVNAARSIENGAIDRQFNKHVTDFLEEVVPHMPGTSQQGAVSMALDYVRERGSFMGSSYVMPKPGEKGIRSQMFPGQTVENTAAVNTAIVQWLSDPKVQDSHPVLRDYKESGIFSNPSEYTVTRLNGQYVANIVGVGSIVLPLREIGDRYVKTR